MSSSETVGVHLRMNTKDIEKELKEIDDRLKKLKTEKPQIEIRAEKLKNAKTEIHKVNIELKELSAKKAMIKADTTDVAKGKKQIAEINTQMDKLRARKAVLQVSTEKLKGADRDAKNLTKEMDQLNKRKAILQVDAEDAVKAEEQMGRLTEKIHEVNTTKASVSVSSALSGIGSGLQGAGDKLLSLNPLNSMAGKVLGIGAAVKVVDAGVNQLKNSVGGAVSRFDTMEKYPKVMQSLGFEAKQSEDSIKALGDGIDGLPTTLDSIVSANQQMVSTTGDINKGTQATIALNNAFLASGADYEKSQRGTAQYLKMLSRGEVDLVSWRTLIDTMPVSLTKVANAFEFTGESAKNDLYDALNAGTITFDQFQDKLIELGTGTGELAELAKINSEGIATSFENLKNSTTKGMANVLGKFSETVKEVTGKNIPQHIDNFKGIINSTFDNINKNMDKTKPFIEKGVQLVESFVEKLKAFNWKGFLDGMKEGFIEVKNVGVALFNTFVKPIAKLFGKGDISKGLGKLPFQLFLLGHGLKFAGGAFKLLGGGFSILEKLNKFKGVQLPFLKESGPKVTPKVDLLNNLKGTASSLANGAKNLALIYGAIKVVEEAAEAMKQVDEKIPDNFMGLARKIGAMSLGIGAIGGLAAIAGKLPKEVLIKGLATVAVVSLEIMLGAEAIRQLDEKIPADFIGVVKKIGTLATAIGAMLLLVGVVGTIATLGAAVIIPGMVAVAAVSLEIMLAAEAIKQLDEKVPNNMKTIAKKIGTIAIAIGAITALDVALGGTALVFGPLIGLGALITKIVSKEIMVAAEAIKQLDDKVPNDTGSVRQKIGATIDVVRYLTNADLGGLMDAFKNVFKGFNVSAISGVLKKMANLGRELSVFPVVEPKKTLDSIDGVKKVIDSLTDGENFLQKIDKLANAFVDNKRVDQIKAYIVSLKTIASRLKSIDGEKIDYEAVKQRMEELMSAISVLGEKKFTEKLLNIGSPDKFKSVKSIISSLKDIMGEINSLSGTIDIEPIRINISLLKEVIGELGNKELFKDYDMGKNKGSKPFASMVKTIGYLVEIANKLNELSGNIDIGPVRANIELLKEVISSLNNQQLFEHYGMKKNEGSKPFASMVKTIGHLITMAQKLNELSGHIEIEAAKANIERIKDVIKSLNMKEIFSNYGMGKGEGSKPFASITKTIGYLVEIANKLNELGVEISYEAAKTNIELIKDAIRELSDPKITESYEKMLKGKKWEKINAIVEEMLNLRDKLNVFGSVPLNTEGISGGIAALKEILEELKTFANDTKTTADSLNSLTQAFDGLINTLGEKTPAYHEIGKNYGESIVAGFKAANVQTKIVRIINKLITALENKTGKFQEIGRKYGEAMKEGFSSGLSGMNGAINRRIKDLEGKTDLFQAIGTSYGDALKTSFDQAIEGMEASIKKLRDNLKDLPSAPSDSSNKSKRPPKKKKRGKEGRSLPAYYATGGFVPKGTDTVPAMLTPGEFVQSRQAVNTFGKDFMDKVNRLDIKGVLAQTYTRFDPSSMYRAPIINNIHQVTTNNQANVTQQIKQAAPNYSLKRAAASLQQLT